jgi:DNA-binding Lrp family transcriptional regulator
MSKPGPAPKVTAEDVLEVFGDREDPYEPLTATEIADALDCSRATAGKRLRELEESGRTTSKKVGGRAVVWWADEVEDVTDTPDFRSGFGALVGTDFADHVAAVGDELDRDFRESERAVSGGADSET